ncbi:MAG: hypothetical protein ACQKBU_04805, partial [Verrucomicrobiales bacterium]
GDLTNCDQEDEWQRVSEAFSRLDGVLPNVVTVGNHDLGKGHIGGSRATGFHRIMTRGRNRLNDQAMLSSWRGGELENAAWKLEIGGVEWLILALEFGPREGAVAWADGVLADHSMTPTLMVTHEWIDHLSTLEHGEALRSRPETHNSPYAYGIADEAGGVHCGEELWERLVRRYSQIRAVFNGHYRPYGRDADGRVVPVTGLASARRVDQHFDGSQVEQLLFNAQWERRGGDGWMLFVEPSVRGLLKVGSYSPVAGVVDAVKR